MLSQNASKLRALNEFFFVDYHAVLALPMQALLNEACCAVAVDGLFEVVAFLFLEKAKEFL